MNRILSLIMDIGEQMLLSGAEVSRVEESIRRMSCAFGAQRSDVFIITSNMEVTLKDSVGATYTQTRRILGIDTDIERLHHLNALARKISSGDMSIETAEKELLRILHIRRYPALLNILSYALISGAFTVFFGGGAAEFLCALAVGVVLALIIKLTEAGHLNKIFAKFFCSFVGVLLAFAALRLGLVPSVDAIIIGFIMTLIPGVGLTVALRDLFVGDSISGVLRTIEAVLFAFAIAGGYFLAAFIMGGGAV